MSRNFTLVIHFILDQLLPPILRDNRFFTRILFRLVFGKKARHYLEFKDRLPFLSEQEIQAYYTLLGDTFIRRPTDLNRQSVEMLLANIQGHSVLDVACGSGWFSRQLMQRGFLVTGADILPPENALTDDNPHFQTADITRLPFPDKSFDTVICAHTLEHVRDIQKALSEIRRVCRKRLIVVLPCQREYHDTFDLHIHFFPYRHKLAELMGKKAAIHTAGGDFVAIEDMENGQ